MAKKIVPLSTQLYEGRKIFLSRLIIYGLYKSLGLASQDIRKIINPESLQVGGHIWLLQLWLNAMFKPSLKTRIRPSSEVGVKDPRLTQLTPDVGKVVSRVVFETHFNIFYMCKSFISTMVPFSNRQYGPEWFREPFLNPSH